MEVAEKEINKGGRPRKWKTTGKTVQIRVPAIFADQVLAIVKEMDNQST